MKNITDFEIHIDGLIFFCRQTIDYTGGDLIRIGDYFHVPEYSEIKEKISNVILNFFTNDGAVPESLPVKEIKKVEQYLVKKLDHEIFGYDKVFKIK